jgi:hypothetical protein
MPPPIVPPEPGVPVPVTVTRESGRVPKEVLGENGLEATRAAQAKINELETALVEATRADLGLGLAKPPKSLLGMLIAAINGP